MTIQAIGQCNDCRWWAGRFQDKTDVQFCRCDMMSSYGEEKLVEETMAFARYFGDNGLSVAFTSKDFGCVMFEPPKVGKE